MVIFGFALVILSLQMVFTLKQSKYITDEFTDVKKKAKENTRVTMGTFRSLMSFKKGIIIILSIDSDQTITDFRQLQGRTVFSQFETKKQYYGLTISQLQNHVNKNEVKAIRAGFDNIGINF